uniref:Uncharacterized protein n=1 Tax=Plectus sambesii TaxID=2011161 RepID=A0A914X387_9BILA
MVGRSIQATLGQSLPANWSAGRRPPQYGWVRPFRSPVSAANRLSCPRPVVRTNRTVSPSFGYATTSRLALRIGRRLDEALIQSGAIVVDDGGLARPSKNRARHFLTE